MGYVYFVRVITAITYILPPSGASFIHLLFPRVVGHNDWSCRRRKIVSVAPCVIPTLPTSDHISDRAVVRIYVQCLLGGVPPSRKVVCPLSSVVMSACRTRNSCDSKPYRSSRDVPHTYACIPGSAGAKLYTTSPQRPLEALATNIKRACIPWTLASPK
ncbi:hypothetical protein EDB92DRAFT_1330814 [Lactarius akahatsu]|uniref:Uncharacterized protein n=1 Tax=Lactarius akahatsu TaxID=416441 RepID=A0AAD4LSR0_9AGAM|nr:hypothetical protein EDB92DRAFT_1330814 [Lactarius akahatsu]